MAGWRAGVIAFARRGPSHNGTRHMVSRSLLLPQWHVISSYLGQLRCPSFVAFKPESATTLRALTGHLTEDPF